ncbi:MAG: ABC transporter permease [Deltaproteobacteria bacterium]|nr:ABC transporter permease [Deltaproteobacteria bacterium]
MTTPCDIGFSRPSAETLLLRLAGDWNIGSQLPDLSLVKKEFESSPKIVSLSFATKDVTDWDTSLLAFLTKLRDLCTRNSIRFDTAGLPEGVRRLLALASAVPERKGARKESVRESFLVRVGFEAVAFGRSTIEILAFIGEAFIAVARLLRGKGRLRVSDLFLIMQETGAQALPIVSLISLLVGLILAFVGAVQLMMFGAQIYVASLVGVAMVRVMGAIMAGIIMAGRTGAAFAAQLGTMQVNEEIDAIKTMGISPMEFLVLPRIIALALMMPLLGLYADLMGILGGLIVGVGMLDLDVMEYYHQTRISVSLNDFWIGLFQSSVFGILVAVAGCLRGMQCGRSASAVGEAATSAVVTGIVSIIVATAIITILCNVIGL